VALRALGATVHLGHAADHVAGVDTVVVSTAIRPDNPELAAARELGLRVLPRAEALAALMTGRRGVAVAGTHGKTTTTSMLTVAVQHCGVDPSFAIGADLNEAASNAHHGSGELFVVEADESDGSFLAYRPYAAIVTNVEPDHLDHYGDAAAVDRAFEDFVTTIEPAASWSRAPTTRARSGWPSTPRPAAPTSGPTARRRTPTSGWTRSPSAGRPAATSRCCAAGGCRPWSWSSPVGTSRSTRVQPC
jgi:UDP-N-acetylmuramate-alanine ligase